MKRLASSSVTRRRFLQGALLAAGIPAVVPAHVLGASDRPAPSGTITLGVLGVGAQGQYDLAAFLRHRDVRVTALCDVNERSLAAGRAMVAEAYGRDEIKLFRDFREMHADRSIDAVLMALPVHWHCLPAVDAILQGKHIYHEKPMAMSFEEARLVRAAVKARNVVFQFGTQQRSDSTFRLACALALSGRLGKLREIHVSVPAGRAGPLLPAQPTPSYVDWARWVGPAPWTPFNEQKLIRDTHEHISNFSLGMISCWGIHHLDIAQWGNGTDDTGPTSVSGEGEFPQGGSLDTIVRWNVRFEYARATPVVFVSDGTPGFEHGVKFIGETAWVQVRRGGISASTEDFLEDPQNREKALSVTLPVSAEHPRNFLDAIKNGTRAIADIGPAVRSDTLCQLALIAVKLGRKIEWDPVAERCVNDGAANDLLRARPPREPWHLPQVEL